MKRLIIIGAGGHGKVCANIAYDMKKWDTIEFLDDGYPEKLKVLNFDVIGNLESVDKLSNDYDYFVAVGDNYLRRKILTCLMELNKNIATIIHPTVTIGLKCDVGIGTSVHQNVVINTDSKVGKGCIINTSTIIEHENVIEDFVHLSPNVTLGGQVVVRECSWIGIGSVVKNNVYITKQVVVGAGSLVLKSIKTSGMYFGSPVRARKE